MKKIIFILLFALFTINSNAQTGFKDGSVADRHYKNFETILTIFNSTNDDIVYEIVNSRITEANLLFNKMIKLASDFGFELNYTNITNSGEIIFHFSKISDRKLQDGLIEKGYKNNGKYRRE